MRKDYTEKLIKKYQSSTNFLKLFNPDVQELIIANENRAYVGSAPSLTVVKLGFGKNIIETWLMAQIENLNNFCGVKEKANALQMLELSKLVIASCGYLKVTELMLFFTKFKMGEYGKFYGVIDPIVITSALNEFLEERLTVLRKIRFDNEKIKKELEQAEYDKISLTREEYEDLKWLFNM